MAHAALAGSCYGLSKSSVAILPIAADEHLCQLIGVYVQSCTYILQACTPTHTETETKTQQQLNSDRQTHARTGTPMYTDTLSDRQA